MNTLQIILLAIVVCFGVLASYQDLRTRKVKNYLAFSLLLISALVYVFYLASLTWVTHLALVFAVLLGFYLYRNHTWGAADGKLFIALSMLVLAYQGSILFGHYLVNIVTFYSLIIIFLTQIMTSSKQKEKAIKSINYYEKTFVVLFIFVVLTAFTVIFDPQTQFWLILSLTLLFLAFMLFNEKYIKRWYNGQKQIIRVGYVLLAALALFSLNVPIALLYFVLGLVARLFIEYISELSDNLESKGKKYYTPFAVFLFVGAFLSILTSMSIISLLL